jgi:signal peptidase I
MAIRVRRHRVLGAGAGLWRGWSTAALVTCIALLLPLTTFLVSAWLLGWQLQSVQSGSMSPTYPVGSLLVVGAIDAADVTPGMPIVFEDPQSPGHLVVHRVVAIAPGESLQFITQGDANPARDPAPVPARMVRGRVLWQVSRLGTTLDWLQWPRSFLILVVVPGLILLVDGWRARRIRPEGSPHHGAGSPKVA